MDMLLETNLILYLVLFIRNFKLLKLWYLAVSFFFKIEIKA